MSKNPNILVLYGRRYSCISRDTCCVPMTEHYPETVKEYNDSGFDIKIRKSPNISVTDGQKFNSYLTGGQTKDIIP